MHKMQTSVFFNTNFTFNVPFTPLSRQQNSQREKLFLRMITHKLVRAEAFVFYTA